MPTRHGDKRSKNGMTWLRRSCFRTTTFSLVSIACTWNTFLAAKNVFQVHAIDTSEKVVVRKQLRRSQVIPFFERLSPCLVGMEACATGHHWARELTKLGHEVRLMPAKDVKAYVKRN